MVRREFENCGFCELAVSGRSVKIVFTDSAITKYCYVSVGDLEKVLGRKKKTGTLFKVLMRDE